MYIKLVHIGRAVTARAGGDYDVMQQLVYETDIMCGQGQVYRCTRVLCNVEVYVY